MVTRARFPQDDARPAVLAHERFAADRASFAGLSLAERFGRIEATNLWGADGSVSGLGSEYPATRNVSAALPGLLSDLGIRTLLDAPCGDAGWILGAGLDVAYIGVDIVPSLIARNAALARDGGAARHFMVADLTRDRLPAADLILCRDCLVHLSFANIARAVANFRSSGATWLLTTSFPEWNVNRDCEDGDWRALNMEHAPFQWPTTALLIDEGCDEGDGGWSDKSLGLWRIADLPS